jgi:hypothetical protein
MTEVSFSYAPCENLPAEVELLEGRVVEDPTESYRYDEESTLEKNRYTDDAADLGLGMRH